MAERSKKVTKKVFVSHTGVEIKTAYCRVCRKNRHPRKFYKSVDRVLDTNGIMSICKDCAIEIFDNAFLANNLNIRKTFLYVCEKLNLIYDKETVENVFLEWERQKDKAEKRTPNPVLSIYRSRISYLGRTSEEMESEDGMELTFSASKIDTQAPSEDEEDTPDDFWGNGYEPEEIEYMDYHYAQYKKNYETSSHEMVVLLQLVVKKMLDIDKEPSAAKEKALLLLMRSLALSPQYRKDSDSKKHNTYGEWLKDIEEEQPAEWLAHEGRELFHDVDNVNWYYETFVKRPLKNFIQQTPDYNIIGEDSGEEEDWSI